MASSQAATEKSPFPSVRRLVTGHTPSGTAIVLRDEIQKPTFWSPGSINAVHDLHRTEEFPAVIDTEISRGEWVDEIAGNGALSSPGGSTFRAFDYAPGSVSPFHRTVTIDYGIVAKGSVILELDNGERHTLNEGDTIVQRGTAHCWRNESTEWARIYFVVLGAQPVQVNGEKLGEKWEKAP